MNKIIAASTVGLQNLVELTQFSSIDTDADSVKMTWHSPELRVLQISQETSGIAGSGPAPSDARLKREIQLLTTLKHGLKIYSFKYYWSDLIFVGVMAQDLLPHPEWRDAVSTGRDGYYSVNYAKLGLKMTTLDLWNGIGLDSIKSDSVVTIE